MGEPARDILDPQRRTTVGASDPDPRDSDPQDSDPRDLGPRASGSRDTASCGSDPDLGAGGAQRGPREATLAPSRIGRYEVQGELGRGGTGVVYEAWDPQLGRTVALKTLFARRGQGQTQLERFLREVRATATLRHPHLVAVHDAGMVDGLFFLAMDKIDGRPLDRLLAEEGALAPRRGIELLLPVVRALAYAHREGFVHRDVKPENVLVDESGEAYLTDFGLAADLSDPTRLTQSHQSLGTPVFMPPEQLRGRTADPRVDVYAVGATIYECLTGRVPFLGDTFPELLTKVLYEEPPPPRRLAPHLSADLEAVILRCLEKEPARRYPSMDELAADLERYLAGEAVRASAPSWGRHLWLRLRRQRSLVLGTTLALLGVLGGLLSGLAVRGQLGAALRQKAHLEQERARLLLAHREATERFSYEEARRGAFAEAALAATTESQLAAYDRLLAQYPDSWEGRVGRARLLRELCHERRARSRDLPGAREACRRAIEDLRAALATGSALQSAPLRLLEAELLRADGKDAAAALRAYRELAASGQGGLSEYARARLLAADGEHGAALEAAQTALETQPDLAPARLLVGEALLRQGHPGQALEVFDALAGHPIVEAELTRLRGEALLQLDAPVGAITELARGVELDPEDARGHVLLGRARLELEQPGRALASLDRALELAHDDPGLTANVRLLQAAAYLEGWGDLPRAMQLVQQARAGGAPFAQDLLGRVRAALEAAAARHGVVIRAEDLRELFGEPEDAKEP